MMNFIPFFCEVLHILLKYSLSLEPSCQAQAKPWRTHILNVVIGNRRINIKMLSKSKRYWTELEIHLSLVSMAEVTASMAASVSEIRRQLRPRSPRETRVWAARTRRHGLRVLLLEYGFFSRNISYDFSALYLRGPQGQQRGRRHRNLKEGKCITTTLKICGHSR